MTKSCILFFIGLLLGSAVYGAESEFFLPTSTGSSARTIRTGNVEGYSRFSNVLFENVAGLYQVNRLSASTFYTRLFQEVAYRNISGAVRLPVGVLGIGYADLGVDDIAKAQEVLQGTSTVHERIGAFEYKNKLIKLGYSYSQSRSLHFGASFNYYSTSIDTANGRGFNFDAGVIIDTNLLDISIAMKNVIPALTVKYTDSEVGENSSDGQEESLPPEFIFGAKYGIRHFDILGQVKFLGEQRTVLTSFGVNFNPKFMPQFHGSLGYRQYAFRRSLEGVDEDAIEGKLTLGFGLDLFNVSFDYAIEGNDHFEFNSKHYFSVAYDF